MKRVKRVKKTDNKGDTDTAKSKSTKKPNIAAGHSSTSAPRKEPEPEPIMEPDVVEANGNEEKNYCLSVSSGSSTPDISFASDDDDSDDDDVDGNSVTVGENKMVKQKGELPENQCEEVLKVLEEINPLEYPRPKDLVLDSTISTICFHPENDIIAVATFSKDIELYKYSETEDNAKVQEYVPAKWDSHNCREMIFNTSGDNLFAAYTNKKFKVYDVEGMRLKHTQDNATTSPVQVMMNFGNKYSDLVLMGDDDGYVTLWDQRAKNIIHSEKIRDDAITAFGWNGKNKIVICSSSDGTLTPYNFGQRKKKESSEQCEYDYTCIGTIKNESKLVVGDSNGQFHLYDWGEWNKGDQFKAVKGTGINCMMPITEETVVYGTEDGCLRTAHFYPHKSFGLLGTHSTLPVEKLDVCNDGHLIASAGHNNLIKFWNISYFGTIDFKSILAGESKGKKKGGKKLKIGGTRNNDGFFNDI